MRILVVEDEEQLAGILKRGLQEHGYAVDVVHDGEDGLAMAEIGEHDVVILDVMLPGLSGFEVARALRARRVNTPVLMLTARDSVDDRVAGLDSGADDYLVKPFAFRELVARVRALLRREEKARDPVLRVADLEVDTVSREVRRARRAVSLTTKEYAVLEYLVRNPNRVLTRTQISEHVWDYDFTAMSNVVDVYIRYLRRKLDDGHQPKLIHTVRGIGYQLKVPR
ncbi:MAG: response regulator transcription factor [Dehalococcoidales bacterium]|nr:response regulator transcription factor [Dehalococcoidales bacterium]